jgi:hypothetical protein
LKASRADDRTIAVGWSHQPAAPIKLTAGCHQLSAQPNARSRVPGKRLIFALQYELDREPAMSLMNGISTGSPK